MNHKIPILRLCLVLPILFLTIKICAEGWGDWLTWGDQGDGTYRNPVLPADFSDIDCIRVGSDYYAICTTLDYSPGVLIIQSKDLVTSAHRTKVTL
jgi:hypothetical protein